MKQQKDTGKLGRGTNKSDRKETAREQTAFSLQAMCAFVESSVESANGHG